ncbi:MAG: PSD1 domain-containing protein [Candidatus Hydrogenedentes bacterium]|nr:PSD1 domain-containing protein [Candidatus Hydrogenedentota bacterium]
MLRASAVRIRRGECFLYIRIALSVFLGAALGAWTDESVSFNRDIRPILANNCFKCHGFDAEARQAGLRLDTFEGATATAKDGKQPIVPSNPDASEVMARITSTDPDKKMPPPETGKKLSPAEIEKTRAWIAAGAVYEEHWAFKKPARPELSQVADRQWPINGIDYFILHRLEQEGLKPSPPADKSTLLRRVYLDLIGLPPTPQEVEAFLNDTSTVAYERVVQRLLDSPQFGERWARPWLDIARYADTKGYEADRRRVIWQYRDWVIRALNADMPFGQFTREQLAGDLLPNATRDQIIATAFHRNTMTNDEGGTDNEEFRNAAVIDRVNTTAEVWLGLTMACAQCHTHKYDPITQTEFYQFYAFFNQTADNDEYPIENPVIPTPDSEQEATLKALDTQMDLAQRRMETMLPELQPQRAAWEEAIAKQENGVLTLGPWQAAGPFPAATFDEAFTKAFPPEAKIDLTAEIEGGLRWVEHAEWQDGVINILEGDVCATYLYRVITSPLEQPVKLSFGSNDSIKAWLNGSEIVSHHLGRGAEPDQEVVTVTLKQGDNTLLLKIANAGGGHQFYFKVNATGHPADIVAIIKTPLTQRLPAQQQVLDTYYTSIAPELGPMRAEKLRVQAEKDVLLAQIPTIPVLQELPPDKQRETHRHIRGSFLNPGEVVAPGTPASLHPMQPEFPPNRLGLAQWLTDVDNPLTARVAVNRFWEQFFGTGIVSTPQDFGTQGELPTHPELLDWLATEFMAKEWSMKELCRLIVTSAAYRQSSKVTPELQERDPNNVLLARGPRFRLSAETLRDQLLASSGLLSQKMYGPSVMPYQPDGIWMIVYSDDKWETSIGDDRYRRGVYTFWRRTSPYPSMTTFDAPSREFCTVRRDRTNTPLQALVTLNDPVSIEAAQGLARRCLTEAGASSAERIHFAFRAVLARDPQPDESAQLEQLCQQTMARYQQDTGAATDMATNPRGPLPAGMDAAEAATWTVVCNVILNLDETVTKI